MLLKRNYVNENLQDKNKSIRSIAKQLLKKKKNLSLLTRLSSGIKKSQLNDDVYSRVLDVLAIHTLYCTK